MTNFIALAIIVVAIVVAALAGRSAWLRSRSGGRSSGQIGAVAQGELVAVIAAAVAAASGMEPDGFRIVGIRGPQGPSVGSPFARSGLNTPAWGHVDRFVQGE